MYHLSQAIMQVLSKPSTLEGIAVPLEDMHVIPNPLLDKYREECGEKAEDEGHEPENIHADVSR